MNAKKLPVSTGTARVTLKDVAQLAGVSVATASLVLSGKAKEQRISPEAEQRVRDVARQQDYSPNLLVRSLRKGTTQVLSLYNGFGPREENDLYMDRLCKAVERAAGGCGYDVLVHCNYSRSIEETYRLLNGGRADGLIYFGPLENPILPLLRRSRMPTVVLNRVDDEGVLSSLVDDMDDGMRQVAEALLRAGHRRIACIASLPGARTQATRRIEALRAHLAPHGVEIPERHIVSVYDEGPINEEEALRYLMADAEPPTALFCWHDRLGYMFLEACERLGIAVPEQLAMISYDGLYWASTSRHILTSVDLQLKTLTEEAVRLLHELIMGERTSPVQRVLPVSLIAGTTLGPSVGVGNPA